jgi:integrase/recombinase XerD
MPEQPNDRDHVVRLLMEMEKHIAFLEGALGIDMSPMFREDDVVLSEVAGIDATIAWRKDLEGRGCEGSTIRRKLSAVSSLFEYLCERNAVVHNPVKGVKRPKANNNEGLTPALSDEQARLLLNAPSDTTLKGKRDRAILATLLYHGLRREELCTLRVRDLHQRQGVLHFRVHGKGDKTRYIPVSLMTVRLITEYLDEAGHKDDLSGALFRPVKNNVTKTLEKQLHPDGCNSHTEQTL